MQLRYLLTASSIQAVGGLADAGSSILNYVDPLIGTVNGGHVFAGPTLPYGMAKPVADGDKENAGGFASNDGLINGFSHMHDSGTGGGLSFGNFPLFPHVGCPNDDIRLCEFPKDDRGVERVNGSVEASPGYFSISLNNSIKVDMTAALHTAIYRFDFQEFFDSELGNKTDDALSYSPVILIDLSDLSGSRETGQIKFDRTSGRITGSGTFSPSFGKGNYELYFCADFSGAELRDGGVWTNDGPTSSEDTLSVDSSDQSGGAWVRFEGPPEEQSMILARVGVSFISTQQACRSSENEIRLFDFDGTRSAARHAWEKQLSPVTVDSTDASESLKRTFWSSLYRTFISPQDYTGENPLWNSSEPYFDSFYCIWDSFRSTHPLLTLVDPHAQALMVRSLLDIYRHEGKLPDCRMSLCKGFSQGGSNADNLLADSYLKGLTDGIDWDTAYEAVISDAEEQSEDWDVEGRGGLAHWKELGYIPVDEDEIGNGLFTRSISRTIEYSYNDFCIAQIARDMGKKSDAEKYLERSKNWINVLKKDASSEVNGEDSGFQAFAMPKFQDGSWDYQDPTICSQINDFDGCYLNEDGKETYEGSSWLYTFYVPHDAATLIQELGGDETFVERLRFFHDTPGLFYVGNEPSYLMIFLFHYVGRPGLSAEYAHRYIPSSFNDTVSGLPGNDDSGAMGSFAALTMMGFYPMSGQDIYLIIPPFFREVNIKSPLSGKTATITTINFDAGYKNIYIQSAKLNGKTYNKSWLTHEFFNEGGELELTLGHEESEWGQGKDNIPPSASTRFW